jgi:predicted nucleotidyltransferase
MPVSLEQCLQSKRNEILRLATKYGARNVRVFGSLVRGEADEASDLDLLVELDPGRSLLDLGGLQFELEALLGCRVDVVTERGLKLRIRDRVLREAVPI